MKRSAPADSTAISSKRKNTFVAVVVGVTVGVFYVNYEPTPAGAFPDEAGLDATRLSVAVPVVIPVNGLLWSPR